MELSGTIKKLGDIQTFASGFQKREMVIVTNEQYPQPIQIEFLKDKIDILDKVNEGDSVTVSINIRGREWTSPQGEVKYFNSITGWRVEKTAAAGQAAPQAAQPTSTAPAAPATVEALLDDEDDGLPF